MRTKLFFIVFLTVIAATLMSCKKYLNLNVPPTQLTSSTVFKNDATALAAQLAIYSQMEAEGFPYNLIVSTGLSSDEFDHYSSNTNYLDLSTNNLTSGNTVVQGLWTSLYKYIYESNAVLEGIEQSTSISEGVRKQLTGEAKFVRAFCHFYLVNLFGKVPLVLSTNYKDNSVIERREVNDVYTQIINDLNDAKNTLSTGFVSSNGGVTIERVRPTKWAAAALLSRAYLFTGKWALAAQNATDVINDVFLFRLVSDPNQVFLRNSTEAIWQLMSVVPRFNTYPGGFLILNSSPTLVAISPSLAKSFESGDMRYSSWIKSISIGGTTYYYPYKYKVGQNASSITEYTMVLRLAELYLIRAEASVMLNDLTSALADINIIRSRASLPPVSLTTSADVLKQIASERRAELFTETGDRWFDIKRTGTATVLLQQLKASNWTPSVDELYPIPQSEILRDPNLSQNAGY